MASDSVPLINMGPYLSDPKSAQGQAVVRDICHAASAWGFFLLTGTGVPPATQAALLQSAKDFFALPTEDKMALDVARGGVAWRGYMPLGGEFTHGRQDWKEGLYIGPEHSPEHPLAGMPLHGRNQFPDSQLPDMRRHVLDYVDQLTELGKTLTDILSLGLGLAPGKDSLRTRLLDPEPVVLFRCFKYTPAEASPPGSVTYGIGEHTDFGYLTLLKVDSPGLQVLSPTDEWVDVPVVDDGFIINVGDMLDQLTHGRFRSRPHRVQRPGPTALPRYSFPLFFDFAWGARMQRLPLDHLPPLTDVELAEARQRWAKTTFRDVDGTWSRYLAHKVQKVFPGLALPDFEPNTAPSTRFTRVVDV
ncbi:hypothetical protein CDD83_29 [Cordyceps sp. RAO-2017]|nr:hypothetical protein CDD83_29 [Cordyceps sp. RAO-2017]